MTSDVTEAVGDVFADLGLPDADERQTKTRLAMAVNDLIRQRGLKQTAAAALLGIAQPKVSALANYRLDQFSVEKLMTFLNALDQDVQIVIRPSSGGAGCTRVLSDLDTRRSARGRG